MPGTKASGGRNAKSHSAHLLEGTFRRDRHGAASTVSPNDPPSGRPARPTALRGRGLAEWTRMVERLELAGTLSTVDDAALYQYCSLFAETEGIADARRATAALVKTLQATIARLAKGAAADRGLDDGPEHDVDLAELIARIVGLQHLAAKYTTQLRQGRMAVRQYLVELGMTPSARSRVTPTTQQQPANKLDRFTKGRA